ncbi:MAG: hypothetical protein QXN77_08060 [Candidatus Caldarchaeum sp.]
MISDADYGYFYQKVALAVMHKKEGYIELAAKTAIISRLLRLEGLYQALIHLARTERQSLPPYLHSLFGGRIQGRDRKELLWSIAAKRASTLQAGFWEDMLFRFWKEGRSLSEEEKMLRELIEYRRLPSGWNLRKVAEVLGIWT